MDFLRGKLKSQTPSLLSDDSWRSRSAVRRRDDIFTSSYSRLSSVRSSALNSYGYKSSITPSYGKYASCTPSPLNSPSLVRTRKLSITNNKAAPAADDVRNTKNRFQSSPESSRSEVLSKDDSDKKDANNDESVDYKELYEEEKKEKEVL